MINMQLNKTLLQKVTKITGWKYDEDLIKEEVEDMIEELILYYETVKEQVEDLEEDIRYNYRPYSERELVEY